MRAVPAVLLTLALAVTAASVSACTNQDTNLIEISLYHIHDNCIALTGGFSGFPGSFAGLSLSTSNLLHLNETMRLSSYYGVRERGAQFDFRKASLFGKPIETGFSIYGQRFNYTQARESSIFAFQRDIQQFDQFAPENLLSYVRYSRGGSVQVQYPLGDFGRVGLAYRYDVSDITTLTQSASEYFNYFHFQRIFTGLDGIRTARLIPSFIYNTVDNPTRPVRGAAVVISTALAGPGSDVNIIEPTIEAKYFHPGFRNWHVIGLHLFGRLLTGYGGLAAPPFDRYYMGGENDLRGFDSWSISPIAYMPSSATVNVLNNDGTPRIMRTIDGFVNVTMTVPVFRPVSVGGDTNVVTNFEYRIPIRGPVTLALFGDAGVNQVNFPSQLRLNPYRIDLLSNQFPQAGFSGRFGIQPGAQRIRTSTGAELQILVPRIKAPIRFYGAYNPSVYRGILQPPPTLDRSLFPNNATYLNAINTVGAPTPLMERRFSFRFAIGRTF